MRIHSAIAIVMSMAIVITCTSGRATHSAGQSGASATIPTIMATTISR